MVRLLRRLFGLSKEDAQEEVWYCRPLLVLDARGEVVWFGDAQISFTATRRDPTVAVAKVISPEAPVPDFYVNGMRINAFPDPHMGVREGRTLWGRDAEGNSFEWRVNRDADQYALNQIHRELATTPD